MIGGFFFFRVVLLPIARRLPKPETLIASVLRRFSGVVWTALLTVLISGLYNFITFFRTARSISATGTFISDYSLYILVLGVKLFIVFLIFTLAIVLTFPYPVFDVFQKKPTPWLNLTVVLWIDSYFSLCDRFYAGSVDIPFRGVLYKMMSRICHSTGLSVTTSDGALSLMGKVSS